MNAQAIQQLNDDLSSFQVRRDVLTTFFEDFKAIMRVGKDHVDPAVRISAKCITDVALSEDKTQLTFKFFDEQFKLRAKIYPRQKKIRFSTYYVTYEVDGSLREVISVTPALFVLDEFKNIISKNMPVRTALHELFPDYVAALNEYYQTELRKNL